MRFNTLFSATSLSHVSFRCPILGIISFLPAFYCVINFINSDIIASSFSLRPRLVHLAALHNILYDLRFCTT
jgi:hypothetical protein